MIVRLPIRYKLPIILIQVKDHCVLMVPVSQGFTAAHNRNHLP